MRDCPEQSEFNSKVLYREAVAAATVSRMKNGTAIRTGVVETAANCRVTGLRPLAEVHAIGFEAEGSAEKQRILRLAVHEAEALACATGVPELVLLTLAEEKVQQARQWFARQQTFKARSYEWRIAA